MQTKQVEVIGMTCEHCVQSVTNEINKITGVTETTADLASGKVTIVSQSPLNMDEIQEAISEAGYQMSNSE